MLELFPNITPANALAALLTTADDFETTTPDVITGIAAGAGTDVVGGRGIMNLARAFAPIGTTTLSFDGERVAVAEALGPAGGALGDWMETSGAFDGLVFQDIYDRGFEIDTTRMMAGRATFGDFGIRADYARGRARAVRRQLGDQERFGADARLHAHLVDLLDERLTAAHGVKRTTDPARAAALLGPDLVAFIAAAPLDAGLTDPRRLATVITHIESIGADTVT
jgi:hypothetical protein